MSASPLKADIAITTWNVGLGHKRTPAVKPPRPCGVNASRLYISSALQQRNIAHALRTIFQVANGGMERAFSVFLLS